jgi:1-pyrroline-5-carboxylate dehydrogenase
MTQTGFRITYATLSAGDGRVDEEFDRGLEVASSWLGRRHASVVAGEERPGDTTYETQSPIDTTRSIGAFAIATDAARRGFGLGGMELAGARRDPRSGC